MNKTQCAHKQLIIWEWTQNNYTNNHNAKQGKRCYYSIVTDSKKEEITLGGKAERAQERIQGRVTESRKKLSILYKRSWLNTLS